MSENTFIRLKPFSHGPVDLINLGRTSMSVIGRTRLRCLAMAAAAAVVVAGCGASGTDESATQGADANAGAAVNSVLKFTSSAPIQNLDPVTHVPGNYPYLALTYDRLLMLDADDNIIPGLATDWSFAEDGSHLQLKLRQDVTFHDGTPFNAEAVKINIERGQTQTDSTIKADLKDITDVEIVDDHTVNLKLEKGTGVALPSVLTTQSGMMVSPKAIADGVDLKKNPGKAGSGPYIITEFVPNEKVVVKKADSYWDPNAGKLAGIELERVPDATTRLKGVQTGQTDLSFVSSANDVVQAEQLAKTGALRQSTTTFRNVLGVLLRADQGDLAKPEVRQAIAHAIDPKQIVALFSGKCAPTRSLYPAKSVWADPSYAYPYEYDPAKAKELVKSVGGAKVSISFASATNTEQPANVILAAMKDAGINAELNPVPNSELEPRFIAGDFQLEVTNTFNPRIDPASTVDQYFLNGYRLATDAKLIEKTAAKAADPRLDEKTRVPMYHDLWKTALEQVWFIPLCNMTNAAIYNDKVVGAERVPWANLGLWDLRGVAKTK
ncbi:ABC transporter substrate-binding protein [Sphaerimonospora cavernae]|uniref:ABC transporter substrate-binding protein n=1 Tax=Sphaerimonospora cavernae TaxID=1740611 RepID=A0ABV6UCH6_9ACTN